jgi:hypothetical protein
VNRRTGRYRVVVDGATVSKDFVTVAPIGAGRWLAYARSAQRVRLPNGAVAAFHLRDDGSRTPVTVKQGAFAAEARSVYLLTARGGGQQRPAIQPFLSAPRPTRYAPFSLSPNSLRTISAFRRK